MHIGGYIFGYMFGYVFGYVFGHTILVGRWWVDTHKAPSVMGMSRPLSHNGHELPN